MTRQNSIPSEANNNNGAKLGGQESAKAENEAQSSSEETAETPALIPLWDLANHVDGIVTTSYNITDAQIEGAAMSDIKKDEQIFIHYGNRNNANLLVHNGYDLDNAFVLDSYVTHFEMKLNFNFNFRFVVENNQADSVAIRLGLSQTDPLVKQRSQLLESIGITKNSEITVLPASRGFISPELLAFVRIFNMNEEQLEHWLAPDKVASDLQHLDCALDTAVEIKTWSFLKMRLTLLLKAFPTTMEEDINLLEQHHKKGQQKLSHIKTMVIQYRIIEKRNLRDALVYIEERSKP